MIPCKKYSAYFLFSSFALFTATIYNLGCKSSGAVTKQNASADSLKNLKNTNFLFWSPAEQKLGYPNIEKLTATGHIKRSGKPLQLESKKRDLSGFTFKYLDSIRTIDDFIRQTNVVGVLVIKGDKILFERYEQGNTKDTRWTCFSVAKSIVSLLYGAAIKDGFIKDLDEPVTKYVTELKGSVYDSVQLRHLLQMSSGIEWNGKMDDPKSDVNKMVEINNTTGVQGFLEFMYLKKRKFAPGKWFEYNTGDADIAAIALSRATGKTLSGYLYEKIWQPFGMADDAYWVKLGKSDIETGSCCVSATLRDYGRIGMFAMNNGKLPDGRSMLPDNWMKESVSRTGPYKGYGYYWWLRKNETYFASGSFGQQIEVDPVNHVVVAVQSFWPVAFNDYYIDYLDKFITDVIKFVNVK